MRKIVVGTRGSKLAMWQAGHILEKLTKLTDIPTELKMIRTAGDKDKVSPFSEMKGQGFFTKEIESALLSGEIDIAVHSMKDLETIDPEGLKIAAMCSREDPREVVLIRPSAHDKSAPLELSPGSTVGSSSARRRCQIRDIMKDVKLRDLRGNVPTRVRKLRDGRYDAIVAAYAGLKRLELELDDLIANIVDTDIVVPAPAQGVLAIQMRTDDTDIESVVSKLNEPEVESQVRLERGLLRKVGGGCRMPFGAISSIDGDKMSLLAVLGIGEEDNWSAVRRVSVSGTRAEDMIDQAHSKLKSG